MAALTPGVVSKLNPLAQRSAAGSVGARLIGLAIASVVPAVFWMILIETAATWLGAPFALHTIWIMGSAITVFLAVVCAPLIMRHSA
jgi:hypothetical protein